MKSILFTGAGSGIGRALARLYAEEGYSLYLGARRPEELEDFAADLRIRSGADVKAVKLDMLDYASHASLYEDIGADLCGVVCCAGYMEEQEKAQSDFEIAEKIINTNYTGCVSLLNITADDLERKGGGFIIGISSVAGDRGRKSNYIYGSAKAGFTAYLSGLRSRLSDSGVHVLTVKPGFVRTKMTEGLRLPPILTAMPSEAAADILRAHKRKKNILYTKWMWKYIMLIIRHIPEGIFKKLSL